MCYLKCSCVQKEFDVERLLNVNFSMLLKRAYSKVEFNLLKPFFQGLSDRV